MRSPEELASLMPASRWNPQGQLDQTRFRARLVGGWDIPQGARLLEIGCGQGDSTAVLADAVGENGHVTAIDLAGREYGAPVTLGESTDALLAGPLGPNLTFRLDCDLLDPGVDFATEAFDAIVLAHCTWYFASSDRLSRTLAKIRPWSKRLCLSEWDLAPTSLAQTGHLLAVLLRGQYEAFRPMSQANVRTPSSRESLGKRLQEGGWSVVSETRLESGDLSDGRWEMEALLQELADDAITSDVPPQLRSLIASERDLLRHLYSQGRTRSLPSYSLVAERS